MKPGFALRSVCVLATLMAVPAIVMAQGDNFGSNNLYYNRQYNDGIYTNARYDKQTYTYNDFYDNLSNYGTWIEDARLGYVWSPDVDNSFRPYYTNGYWVATTNGNTWISGYIWGWACFHYGRWTYDAYYGWLWVPGENWGAAWVSWRSNAGHYAWAPLTPEYDFTHTDVKPFNCPKDWWIFIPQEYLYEQNYYRYYTGPMGNSTMLKGSSFVDNTQVTGGITYVQGPSPMQVKDATGKTITVLHINNAGTPRTDKAMRDIVKMFRPPVIKETNLDGEKYVPTFSIKAPRPVATTADAVNTNSGAVPAFRKELPALLKKAASQQRVVKKIPSDGPATEAERADKFDYKTELPNDNPKVTGSSSLPKNTTAPLPPQGSQQPEPVEGPKHQPTPLPPPSQSPDPIPSPATPPAPDKPLPIQKPEPINPGSR